jgi:pyridoxine/pyridoxamine 5'-phosphate oxidase
MRNQDRAEEAYSVARAIDKEHTARWIAVIERYLNEARREAIEDAADLVMKAAHNAAHEGVARCLREVADKIRETK